MNEKRSQLGSFYSYRSLFTYFNYFLINSQNVEQKNNTTYHNNSITYILKLENSSLYISQRSFYIILNQKKYDYN